MNEKANITSKILITILSIMIITILAISIYMIFIKDNSIKDNEEPIIKYTKIDNNKGTYYTIKGNSYDLYSVYNGKYEKYDNKKISFDYPVININTESVKKLNNDIKLMYDNLLNEIKAGECGCTCIKIEDKYYGGDGDHIPEYSYSVYENEDFITLKINETLHTDCASGYSFDYLYTISKRNGKVLTDNEIINALGYNRNNINKTLPTFIQSLYETDISNELENITDNLVFFPYNDHLVIGYDIIDGTDYVIYDGNSFKDFDYNIFNSIFKK